MAWGRRCDMGCESWPNDSVKYGVCPQCGMETSCFSNLHPLTKDEAEQRVKEIEFERVYEEHCARLGQTVDGPIDGEVRLPALDEIQALEQLWRAS